ncbi:MAG: hypothetical protein ABIS23_03425 [Sphingomicrobium sp.]
MAKEKKAKKSSAGARKKAKPAKAASSLKAMAANPMVQEVVAAALVATAAALKDTKKARAMAVEAGDQLEDMARDGSEKGKALWALALEVARRAGDILVDKKKAKKKKAAPKATRTKR